ncbi:hypothetical protein BGX28_002324 [Mortierella sp. GBA30]|nr:hypothetical protein BGX28_002324 [Mortierella sp. GBA30]
MQRMKGEDMADALNICPMLTVMRIDPPFLILTTVTAATLNKHDVGMSLQRDPQIEVILQGLPFHCQEDDIRAVIENEDIGLETVRIAKDRQTGELRGYGFLKFLTLQHAQEFMRQFAPSIRIGPNWVRIAYSNNPSISRDAQRRCNECGTANHVHSESCHQSPSSKQAAGMFNGRDFREHSGRTDYAGHPQSQQSPHSKEAYASQYHHAQATVLNVGARDVGTVPNSILVVTDLPSMVNEPSLWNAMSLLGPLVRIMVAKDRQSRISWGFCFAEYTDVKSATKAFEKANSDTFTIQKKSVDVHFAHHGSFIPAYAPTQWTVPYGGDDKLAIYWDEQAFLSVYVDPSAARPPSNGMQSTGVKRKPPNAAPTDELDAFYAAMGDVLKAEPSSDAKGSVFSVPMISGETAPAPIVQDLPALPTAAKMDEVQLAGIAAAQAAEQLAKAEEKKRKAGQMSSIGIGGGGKKVSIQLQKWSTKQVELQSGEVSSAPQQQTSEQEAARRQSEPQQQRNQLQELLDFTHYGPDELLDLKLIACLLCQRKLKTLQDLRKHQSLSELHKKNLLDPQAIQEALKKARGISSILSTLARHSDPSTTSAGIGKLEEEPKYRDRAAERRQIFGQPDYPLPPTPSGRDRDYGGGAGRYVGGGGGYQHEVVIPEQPTKDGIKEDNIGNRLLKSMGWKEGQGLGKDGEGIKAPIEASGYAKGVGIGAGLVRKADGTSTVRGPLGNYAESVKELARRRYEQSE